MEELKPCPFCGGEANLKIIPNHYGGVCLDHYGDIYWVKCENCNAETASDFDKGVAITAWNRRADDIEQLVAFAHYVARYVIDEEYWRNNAEAFPEVVCRKLSNLGIVKETNENWIYESTN